MNILEDSLEINGQKLTLQTGKLAKAATTSVFGRLGDTCVLVTVTTGKEHEDIDFVPLQVEYVEKLYAGGRIKGSRWVKREGRPSDDAVLKARLIDRSIRPLFPKGYRKDVQVIITLLSVDGINSPEILAAIATSAALHISSIPWNGPISTMRVGYVKDKDVGSYITNPTEDDMRYSALDLVVSSTDKDKVIMIETKSEELSEDIIKQGIILSRKENLRIVKFIESLRKKAGRPKETFNDNVFDEKIIKILKKDYQKHIDQMILKKAEKEFDDGEALEVIVDEVMEKYKEEFERKKIIKVIDYLSKQTVREKVIKTKKRIDGRSPDQIREIGAEVSILPRTHGSGLFHRGDTQVLSIVTLGAPQLEQLIESPEGEAAKSYIHHYYMPPYSVGETGRVGFPSRREIGHGALAEKAIEPVLPSNKEFPYTIRVVSEVMSSNGSTSMASTCGSTLALMDAGVPIKSPVAGIAVGMMSRSDNDYVILTDIAGIEDFSGDMDFKVAGTVSGVTAIQLDVKNSGLTEKMIEETLEKAKTARLFILEKMKLGIEKPREEISRFAPKVVVLTPPQEKIGEIIGPGGRNIRSLIAKTDTEIDVSDDGRVTITGLNKEKVDEAVKTIENITREVQVGEEFVGEIKRVLAFGPFVELFPGKEGLIHVSKLGMGFVKDATKVVKVGQKVKVKVIEIDNQGRINLQMLK
ncbi:polyribonucleotide nucleotidyltransferase [Candidatus Roizmanbacteria bacterium]|nr:polyribonucleotide nucleotidyltransferase [Candidatus Roizmanbacteria bacterium]